jgi:hypothetical protein
VISLAVPAAGWVVSGHPEITPPSNFHQPRDTTLFELADKIALEDLVFTADPFCDAVA